MSKTIQYKNLEEVYKDVYGIVEANSYESLMLWKEWHGKQGYSWIQNNSGWLEQVGVVGARGVWISPLAHIVNGRKILFIEATSALVDWEMIDNYLKENVPSAVKENGYLNKQNASNFHCLIH